VKISTSLDDQQCQHKLIEKMKKHIFVLMSLFASISLFSLVFTGCRYAIVPESDTRDSIIQHIARIHDVVTTPMAKRIMEMPFEQFVELDAKVRAFEDLLNAETLGKWENSFDPADLVHFEAAMLAVYEPAELDHLEAIGREIASEYPDLENMTPEEIEAFFAPLIVELEEMLKTGDDCQGSCTAEAALAVAAAEAAWGAGMIRCTVTGPKYGYCAALTTAAKYISLTRTGIALRRCVNGCPVA
jgi:hypothetical protein